MARFYFMEMNTRIQVEHPVTEMITGLDLVKMQIEVARGDELDLPRDLRPRGHAIECRINAEHPETFVPCPGTIETFHAPGGPGIRLDTHAYEDYRFPPNYDSLIAKLLAWGQTREEAIARMRRALGGCPYAPGATGNLATEDLVYFLWKMNIESRVSLDGVARASGRMSEALGLPLASRARVAWVAGQGGT